MTNHKDWPGNGVHAKGSPTDTVLSCLTMYNVRYSVNYRTVRIKDNHAFREVAIQVRSSINIVWGSEPRKLLQEIMFIVPSEPTCARFVYASQLEGVADVTGHVPLLTTTSWRAGPVLHRFVFVRVLRLRNEPSKLSAVHQSRACMLCVSLRAFSQLARGSGDVTSHVCLFIYIDQLIACRYESGAFTWLRCDLGGETDHH